MPAVPPSSAPRSPPGLLARLLRDRAGNTLAMVAAALFPMLGLIGGGIDIGRGYISESRLQQACDAGVLAARKRIGTEVAVDGQIPDDAAEAGVRFFNLNFRNGAYGSVQRNFEMSLEDDYSVYGRASVEVPTTLMAIFGKTAISVAVECQAQLNTSNMDVMMVLDTTGSMASTNPGDSEPKIQILRAVVKSFYAQLEANKAPGARTRYGFVPYSSNVNVGYLLESDWMVDETTVQARVSVGSVVAQPSFTPISGTAVPIAPYTAPSCPASTVSWVDQTVTTAANGKSGTSLVNGTAYSCSTDPATGEITVSGTTFTSYLVSWFLPTGNSAGWKYEPLTYDVSPLKGSTGNAPLFDGAAGLPLADLATLDPIGLMRTFRGCIEERKTYEIADYDNVDPALAIDLDIDRMPDPSNPDTQWRPIFSEFYLYKTQGAKQIDDLDTLLASSPLYLLGWQVLSPPACPAQAQKLTPMTASDIAAYVDALQPGGNTYHDIGMIWGARLLSPTGIFAEENADVLPSRPTSRHLVFLTDGETATSPANYASYGIEPYDKRRWRTNSPMTLNQTVENRFAHVCEETKKKNITVWVISFGTAANPIMENCAGADRYFVADNAEELESTFATIAKRMGELRVTR